MKAQNNYSLIFWLINLGMVGFKFLFAHRPDLDLFTEEAQYWLWSRNLDWQYYSKPPMVAVLNFLSTSVLGHTEWAIRLIPAVLGFLSASLIFTFAKRIYQSEEIGFWAGIIFLAMPISFLGFTFHTTDTSVSFFWILAWMEFYKAIHSAGKKHWVWTGVFTALGILSKSTMLLIFPAGFLYLLLTKALKKHFANFALFSGVSLVGFIPGIIWNFQHDFYTFRHISTLGGANSNVDSSFDFSLLLSRTSEYLSGQLVMVSVFFIPFFVLAIIRLAKSKNYTSLFLVLPGLLTFLGFGALSLKTWIEVNWPGFAYGTLAIFLSHTFVSLSTSWKSYRNFATILSLALLLLLYLPNFWNWKSSGPIHQGEKALVKRVLGYEELGKRVQTLADSLGGTSPVIFSESYHTASELAFYLPSHPQTLVINMGSRKNQWDLWPGMDLQVGNTGRFIFVSRTKENPGEVAKFSKLIYEEQLPYFFGSDSMGRSKIQIWEHLLEYKPVETGTF